MTLGFFLISLLFIAFRPLPEPRNVTPPFLIFLSTELLAKLRVLIHLRKITLDVLILYFKGSKLPNFRVFF